jgi:hypothetical protein
MNSEGLEGSKRSWSGGTQKNHENLMSGVQPRFEPNISRIRQPTQVDLMILADFDWCMRAPVDIKGPEFLDHTPPYIFMAFISLLHSVQIHPAFLSKGYRGAVCPRGKAAVRSRKAELYPFFLIYPCGVVHN